MKYRKSKICLKWCNGLGCYDKLEIRECGGIRTPVWVSYCKERDKLHKKINNNKPIN